MPIVSPDSRAKWFESPSTPSNRRSNQMPRDNDRDGLIDEDPAEDLDGDGSITQMWKRDPRGGWVRDRFDDRVFTRVPAGETGDWTTSAEKASTTMATDAPTRTGPTVTT